MADQARGRSFDDPPDLEAQHDSRIRYGTQYGQLNDPNPQFPLRQPQYDYAAQYNSLPQNPQQASTPAVVTPQLVGHFADVHEPTVAIKDTASDLKPESQSNSSLSLRSGYSLHLQTQRQTQQTAPVAGQTHGPTASTVSQHHHHGSPAQRAPLSRPRSLAKSVQAQQAPFMPSSTRAQVGLAKPPSASAAPPARASDRRHRSPAQASELNAIAKSEISPESSASQLHHTSRVGRTEQRPARHRDERLSRDVARGEADEYYHSAQEFGPTSPNHASRVDGDHHTLRPRPGAIEQQHAGQRNQDTRAGHGHHNRRPVDKEDHDYFIAHSTLHPGVRGYMRGLLHLLLGRRYVKEDTPERLDLLNRADNFFNHGFIGHMPGLGKERKGRFRDEMVDVTKTLLEEERHARREQRRGEDHGDHYHDRHGRCRV